MKSTTVRTNTTPAERLARACEPVFDFVGECNRLARRGSPRAAGAIREELVAALRQAGRAHASDYEIADLLAWPEVGPDGGVGRGQAVAAMMAFADHALASKHPDWSPLAREHGIADADRRFVEMCERAMRPGDAADATLAAALYACVGLGYGGSKTYELAWMRGASAGLAQRLGSGFFGAGMIDDLVWDQPYGPTYLGDHRPKAGGRVALIVSCFGVCVLLLLGFSVAAYSSAAGAIRESLGSIVRSSEQAMPAEPASN